MHPFILVLTEPFVALPLCLIIGSLSLMWYASMASESWKKYSRFLERYNRFDIVTFLAFVGGINFFLFLFSCMGHTSSENWAKKAEWSEGLYLYAFLAVSLTLFFFKAPLLEKRDLVGLHKQKAKRLEQLLAQHVAELQEQFQFEGRTKIQSQRMLSQLKQLQVEVVQEKKRRKNQHNLYRSLERLEKIETERCQVLAQMEALQKDILSMYDTLYNLEVMALDQRFDNMKKLLNVAKEKLQRDPFEAQVYLNQIQKKEKEFV